MIGRIQDGALDVPAQDQWLCIGAALMNFLNALHLMGYGAKVLGGTSIYDSDVQQAFCAPGESLAVLDRDRHSDALGAFALLG